MSLCNDGCHFNSRSINCQYSDSKVNCARVAKSITQCRGQIATFTPYTTQLFKRLGFVAIFCEYISEISLYTCGMAVFRLKIL